MMLLTPAELAIIDITLRIAGPLTEARWGRLLMSINENREIILIKRQIERMLI